MGHPAVGVGAVVFHDRKVLLIKRGKAPLEGRWIVPGGTVEPGESLLDALRREVSEETGLAVRPGRVATVVDHIERDGETVTYHYVIVDYVCTLEGGTLRAGSDAADAAWVPVADLDRYDVPEEARRVILDVFQREMTGLSKNPDPGTI